MHGILLASNLFIYTPQYDANKCVHVCGRSKIGACAYILHSRCSLPYCDGRKLVNNFAYSIYISKKFAMKILLRKRILVLSIFTRFTIPC